MSDDDPSALAGSSLPGLAGSSAAGGAGLLAQGAGIGVAAVGAYGQYEAQQGISQASQNIAALQAQANQVKFNQAKISARRNQMEVLRNEQRARSLALSNSVNQGAQFGSGLQGGYGQIAGQSNTNLLGISQNLQTGAQLYSINQSISSQEQALAKYQGQVSMWGGVSSLGSGATSLGNAVTKSSTSSSGSSSSLGGSLFDA